MDKLKSIISDHPRAARIVKWCMVLACVMLVLTVTVFAYNAAGNAGDGMVNVGSAPANGYTGGEKIVTLNVLGKERMVRFHGDTVAQLLTFAGVTVPENAEMSAEMEDPVTDGMVLVIRTVEIVSEVFTLAIPFETEYVETDYLPQGQSVVLTEGTPGTLKCVGPATYINGVVVDRTAESSTVQTEPVNGLIAVGTGTGKAKQGMPIVGQNKLLTWDGQVLEFTHKDEFKATCYYRFPVDGEVTAMGTPTRVGAIAVDPTVIPYWTRMYIVTQDGEYIYGIAVAEDCGTAIKGNWVDLFLETYKEACEFGRRQVDIYFLV